MKNLGIKKNIRTFILFVSALILSLLLGEGIVRKTSLVRRIYGEDILTGGTFIIPSDHKRVKYTLKPGFKGPIHLEHNMPTHPMYTINSLGLRGEEPQGNPESVRVMVVGNSMSFGLGVADHEVYPVLLENHLNAWRAHSSTPPLYEIYNCAVPGYNAEQEYYFCKDLVPHSYTTSDYSLASML